MLKLSLGLGVSSSSKLPSGGAAPSGISLTAPTIYLSGLTLTNGIYYTNGIYSPYTLVSSGYWQDVNGVGYVTYSGQWFFYVFALDEDSNTAYAWVANNTAPATSLPTTGWVNKQEDLTVSGTLVISTTP